MLKFWIRWLSRRRPILVALPNIFVVDFFGILVKHRWFFMVLRVRKDAELIGEDVFPPGYDPPAPRKRRKM